MGWWFRILFRSAFCHIYFARVGFSSLRKFHFVVCYFIFSFFLCKYFVFIVTISWARMRMSMLMAILIFILFLFFIINILDEGKWFVIITTYSWRLLFFICIGIQRFGQSLFRWISNQCFLWAVCHYMFLALVLYTFIIRREIILFIIFSFYARIIIFLNVVFHILILFF